LIPLEKGPIGEVPVIRTLMAARYLCGYPFSGIGIGSESVF
jgi:hypothetical protein